MPEPSSAMLVTRIYGFELSTPRGVTLKKLDLDGFPSFGEAPRAASPHRVPSRRSCDRPARAAQQHCPHDHKPLDLAGIKRKELAIVLQKDNGFRAISRAARWWRAVLLAGERFGSKSPARNMERRLRRTFSFRRSSGNSPRSMASRNDRREKTRHIYQKCPSRDHSRIWPPPSCP